MKTKKTKRANLENYRTIFLQIGLILTLSAILVAFEWNSAVNTKKLVTNSTNWFDMEELPPVTRPKPEKVDLKPPTPVERIIIRKDNVDIKEDPIFEDTEIDWNEGVDIHIYEKQEEEVVEDFIKVEIKPTFKGKDAGYFRNYIASHLKFPQSAVETGITGTVKASFIIAEDGSVSNVEITRSVHPTIDKAVIEAIQNSPKWEPGMQKGRFVSVRYSIAIAFRLE